MSKIVPIDGHFTDRRALLAHIAEDDTVEGLVIVTKTKTSFKSAHLHMTHEEMALASLILADKALND